MISIAYQNPILALETSKLIVQDQCTRISTNKWRNIGSLHPAIVEQIDPKITKVLYEPYSKRWMKRPRFSNGTNLLNFSMNLDLFRYTTERCASRTRIPKYFHPGNYSIGYRIWSETEACNLLGACFDYVFHLYPTRRSGWKARRNANAIVDAVA